MYAECGPVVMGDLTNKATFEPELKGSAGREPCGYLREVFWN